MPHTQRIAPCLWFDDQAEQAANFYTSIFKRSRIVRVSRYGEAGKEHHGRAPGSVMVVAFELDGQPFTALNGGPVFKFNEAVSLQVSCETQVDDRLGPRESPAGDAGHAPNEEARHRRSRARVRGLAGSVVDGASVI